MRTLISAFAMLFFCGTSLAAAPAVTRSGTGNQNQTRSKAPKIVMAAGESAPMVHIIPTLGMTFNRLSGEDSSKSDIGVNAAIILDIGTGPTVFQTGLGFTQLNSTFDAVGANVVAVQNYISIPIIGKSYFLGTQAGTYLKYGVTANFLTGAKIKADEQSVDAKKFFGDRDIAGAIGVGYRFSTAERDALVELTINRSFSRVNTVGDGSVYNQTVMLNTGLIF